MFRLAGVIVLCCVGGALSWSSTPCSLRLRSGGCVDKRTSCPYGTVEVPEFSNYVGCFRVDQKCCGIAPVTPTPTPTPKDPRTTLPPKCGRGSSNSDRILDGSVTGVCDWPFVVSIRARLRAASQLNYAGTSHSCQGVLIDKQWVLTSPFCVYGAGSSAAEARDRILVVAGEYNVSRLDINPTTGQQQEQIINVDSVYIHPNYAYANQAEAIPFDDSVKLNSNGVALIKLSQPITGSCSGVICLPTPEEAANSCAGYDECVITGWGFSTESFDENLSGELLYGKVRLSSEEACNFLTDRLGLKDARPTGSICQSPANILTDSCLGDEGGAVMCSNGNNWVVRGILPFNMCSNGRYNLYVTEVAPYLTWIQNTMDANGGDGSQTMVG
ncbi:trypsin-4-like [Physella acuta]|uniref:trypsin-4-like n=1 Tax=Physella acuta TaxID=109671 RepID=UPI0027DD0DF7|nr:trypsin-4-like [Physella acuta]